MAQVWIRDDGEIIVRLKKRYLGTQSIELNILMFEELSQNEGEDLAAYMTRCQQKGLEAFQGLGEPISTQQRIIWKFLSGIKDQAIRSEVIRQRWMKSPTEPKGYDEVLLIAEQAKLDKLATTATGNGSGFGKKGSFQAAPVSKVSERRKAGNYKARTPHTSGESSVRSTPSPIPSRGSFGSSSDSNGGGSSNGNFLCHFCKTTSHFGGWKACPKRAQEEPSWKPGAGF